MGLISDGGTKIPQAAQYVQNKQANKTLRYKCLQTRQTRERLPLPTDDGCLWYYLHGGERETGTLNTRGSVPHYKSWDLVVSLGFSLKLDLPDMIHLLLINIYDAKRTTGF